MKSKNFIYSLYIFFICIGAILKAQDKKEILTDRVISSEYKLIVKNWTNFYSIKLSDFSLKSVNDIVMKDFEYDDTEPLPSLETSKNKVYSMSWMGEFSVYDKKWNFNKIDKEQVLFLSNNSKKTRKRVNIPIKKPYAIDNITWDNKEGFMVMAVNLDKKFYNYHIFIYNLKDNKIKEYEYSTKKPNQSKLYFYKNLKSKGLEIKDTANFIEYKMVSKIYYQLESWLDYYSLDLAKFKLTETSKFDINIPDSKKSSTYLEYLKPDDDEYNASIKDYSDNKQYSVSWFVEMLSINDKEEWIYDPEKVYNTYFYNSDKKIAKNLSIEGNYVTTEGVFWKGNNIFTVVKLIRNLNRLDGYRHIIEVYNFDDNSVKKYHYDSTKIYYPKPFLVHNLKNKGINIVEY